MSCLFCEHDEHEEFCNVPACGDGCCHCSCYEYVPFERDAILKHIRGIQKQNGKQYSEIQTLKRKIEELEKMRDFQFRARQSAERREREAQKALSKALKKKKKKEPR